MADLYEAVRDPESGWVVVSNHPGLLRPQVLVVFGDDQVGAERERDAMMREQFPPYPSEQD